MKKENNPQKIGENSLEKIKERSLEKIGAKNMQENIIYTRPECMYCKMMKNFFIRNNIPFVEKDITDLKIREELYNLIGQCATPVLVHDGKPIIGFDELELRQMFEIVLV